MTSEGAAERRSAARILVLDGDGHILLFRGGDPGRPRAGTWWFTPGGGLEAGESFLDAANRELEEETGLRHAGLAGPVHAQDIDLVFDGVRYLQHEEFFGARVDRFEVDDAGWTLQERDVVEESRWWSPDALADTTDLVYPEDLVDILVSIEVTSRRPAQK